MTEMKKMFLQIRPFCSQKMITKNHRQVQSFLRPDHCCFVRYSPKIWAYEFELLKIDENWSDQPKIAIKQNIISLMR
jgi:hypothetical protein